jgi:hypothetical protein
MDTAGRLHLPSFLFRHWGWPSLFFAIAGIFRSIEIYPVRRIGKLAVSDTWLDVLKQRTEAFKLWMVLRYEINEISHHIPTDPAMVEFGFNLIKHANPIRIVNLLATSYVLESDKRHRLLVGQELSKWGNLRGNSGLAYVVMRPNHAQILGPEWTPLISELLGLGLASHVEDLQFAFDKLNLDHVPNIQETVSLLKKLIIKPDK